MIQELTKDQEAKFPFYVDKWTKIGLSTKPLDKAKAEKAVCFAYQCAGEKAPKDFHFASSPQAAKELIKKLSKGVMRDSEIINSMMYGAQDSGWLSFYDFCLTELEIDACKKLEGLMAVAEHCGWWSGFDTCAVIQEKPIKILFDEDGQSHGETGPAIEYSDGFGVYMWHGTRVKKNWILNPENINLEELLRWPNMEQRRAGCEIVGWVKILKKLNGKSIDKFRDCRTNEFNPEIGELFEVDLPDLGKSKFLKYTCDTGREFASPMPQTMQTAMKCQIWLHHNNWTEKQILTLKRS